METFLVGTSRARDVQSYSRDRRRREGRVAITCTIYATRRGVSCLLVFDTRGVFLSKRLSNKLALVPLEALGDFVDHQRALREEHQRPEEEAREQKRPLGG